MSDNKEEAKVGLGQKIVFGLAMFVASGLYYIVFLNKSLMVLQNLAYPY